MIYSENPNTGDGLNKTREDSSSYVLNNQPVDGVEIEIIMPCDSSFIEYKENLEEINSLLKNLSQHTDCESDDEKSDSQEEIRSILSRKTTGVEISTSITRTSYRQISLVGKILLTDNKLISKIICPIKNNKLIPSRVSNPLYKNLYFDS